ncbi:TIGR02099 family protein [Pleionea sp. CnH1-48]|nr:TIGR02099 family protein [Pleionea sp. CnH1-48]
MTKWINRLWLAFASLVITLAVLFSIARAALPFTHYFHHDIEAFLTQKLGVNVKMESIASYWKGEGPEIRVEGISVETSNGQQPLTVESVLVRFDFWRSVLSQTLVTSQFSLNNSSIKLNIDDVSLALLGTEQEAESYDSNDFFVDVLLGQNDVQIHDLQVEFYQPGTSPQILKLDHLSIANYDKLHQVEGELLLDGEGALTLIAEINGDPRHPESAARFYIKSEAISIPQLPFISLLTGEDIKEGKLSAELWADWTYSRGWSNAWMGGELADFQYVLDDKKYDYPSLAMELVWDKEDEFHENVRLSQLKVTESDGRETDLSGLELGFNHFERESMLVKYGDISPGRLNGLWALLLREKELRQWFLRANPQIDIGKVVLEFVREESGWNLTNGIVHIDELKVEATESTPSLPSISTTVEFRDDTVHYKIVSEQGIVSYRPMFRYDIPLKKLVIEGEYYLLEESSQLLIERLSLLTPDLSLEAMGNLYFPVNADAEISLYAELSDVDLKNKSLYFPVTEMGDELVEYLDTSVIGGRLDFAQFNFQGRLVSAMLEQPDVTFDILGYAPNLNYEYLPEWPKLERLSAELYFNQNAMRITALEGKLWGVDVNKAIARIDDFSAKETLLSLDIAAELDGMSGRRFVDESPLKNNLGTLLHDLQVENGLDVAIKLDVPLEHSENLTIDGKVALEDSRITLPALELEAEKVNGVVKFTESGVSAKKVKLAVMGGNSTIDLSTIERDEKKHIKLGMSGNLDVVKVNQWLADDMKFPVSGVTDYVGSGLICIDNCGKEKLTFNIKSELTDIAVKLPEPLTKLSEESWPLLFELSQTDQKEVMKINVGEQLSSELVYRLESDERTMTSSYLLFGEAISPEPTEQPELGFHINYEELSLIEWIEALSDVFQETDWDKGEGKGLPSVFYINVEKLTMEGIYLSEVKAKMSPRELGGFDISFLANEGNGVIRWLDDGNMEMHFYQLNLPQSLLAENESEEINIEPNPYKKIPQGFSGWPQIRVVCDDCNILGISLGQIKGVLRPATHQLEFDGQVTQKQLINAPVNIRWFANGEEQNTHMEARLSSDDMGGLMRLWGVKVGIQESEGTGVVALNWPGSPFDFDISKVDGGLSLELGAGYIEEISDAKARIVSLFSLQSIRRRLTLDFKDIYKEGFFYDKIRGDFSMKNGRVFTNNLGIDGNAAAVDVEGSVDLAEQTFDQRVYVLPKVTSSLPVLAGWAVEPATGILVYLLSKVFEPAVEVITRIEYKVSGPWDNPDVVELKKTTREVKVPKEELEQNLPSSNEEQQNGQENNPKSEQSSEEVKPQSNDKDSPEEAEDTDQPESRYLLSVNLGSG